MPTTLRTPRRLAVIAMFTGLALIGACSNGDDNTKPSDKVPSGNTSTGASKTSTETTSTPPTKTTAPKPTKQGAIDAAVTGLKALDQAYSTLKVDTLRHLSLPQCETCTKVIKEFPKKRVEGYQTSGGRISITANAHPLGGSIESRQFLIEIPAHVSYLTTKDPRGNIFNDQNDLLGSGPGIGETGGAFLARVKFTEGRWQLLSIGVE